MKIFIFSLLFSLNGFAQNEEVYGPMPQLSELSPNKEQVYQQQLKLDYENWYQRYGRDLSSEQEYEWSLRPHNEITDAIKDKAVNGGLKVNEAIKQIRPTQLQGELIIRY